MINVKVSTDNKNEYSRIEGFCSYGNNHNVAVIAFSKIYNSWSMAHSVFFPSIIEDAEIINNCYVETFKKYNELILNKKGK